MNYFRILIEWHTPNGVLPNAIDVQLVGGSNPMMAAPEIRAYIESSCGVPPKSWTWKPITQADYDLGDNAWVEADGSNGTIEIFEPKNGVFDGIKTKNVMVIRR